MAASNKVYLFLFFVRVSSTGGYTEYNMNDTEGNCNVCVTQKQVPSGQISITNYTVIQKAQGKSVVADESSDTSSTQTNTSEPQIAISIAIDAMGFGMIESPESLIQTSTEAVSIPSDS